ncbi:NUDIX domain-containing protein [Stipitochalara longipes BDJ]|nr:NUDIX domain-containing protein [Stipitochalara longipes BDJ]
MAATPKTYLDLVNDCDRFPYDDAFKPPGDYWSSIYQFLLPEDPRTHGFMLASTVKRMPWTDDFVIDHEARMVRLSPAEEKKDLAASCTTAFSKLIQRIIDEDTFRVIHRTHSEPYPIIGANFPVSIERYASTLFGIISRGAHLTAYTRTASGLKIWVPRRSPNLFTYPNCLDTTVAGGVAFGEGPFECVVREADEEASLPEELVRKQVVHCGCISYVGLNDRGGGGETGLIAPDIMYVYDLEIPEDVICKQNDDEVKEFYLMTIDEVKGGLANAEFKTNSALVMIDFFVRHGIITAENETNYPEIIARLHRRLPLPTHPQ